MRNLFITILSMIAATAFAAPTDYVNPFIGQVGNGHTFPGACLPFGMIQTSPVTGAIGWDYCSEYKYDDSEIWGFTQEHLNGTGCMDLGDILVMPVTSTSNKQNFRSQFTHEKESARPGYYTVDLLTPQVKAELTCTPHVAYHRYTYTNAEEASVLVDLQHGPVWREEQYHSHVLNCEVNWENDHTISGHVRNSVWVTKDYYFVIEFSRPMTGLKNLPLQKTEKGNRMIISFDMNKGEHLEMKIALSANSIEAAHKNLNTELAQWDFDGQVKAADAQWNKYLSMIDIEGTEDQKVNFYTSYYHALIQPNNIADCGEEDFFSTFSCWDTYRAAHPFYTIMMPDKVNGFVRSLIRQADEQGFLPIWGLWGKENYCMVANHAVSIVAEAYHKGIRDYDVEKAFEAIKKTQTISHPLKSNWEMYDRYGYFPTDSTAAESVSSTLESVYDDYAAWDMASLMGKKEDMAFFAKRKEYFKNLFDAETGFMRPRRTDGTWRSPFDPAGLAHAESSGGDYTEGNAWQYTWHVQHDIPALVKLMGGKQAFLNKLDQFFTTKLESNLADVTGLIGQYAHGNEPSHHVAYLYAMLGKPERTQELVREIFDTQYLPKVDGLCGNDDCGQMSAWYMLSAMGFYPVDPVSAKYIFGAPQIPQITLHLPNGKTFTVVADGLSKENMHVASITLNGKAMKNGYITHEQIMKGGKLVFKMKK